MLDKFRKDSETDVDELIDTIISDMKYYSTTSEDYATLLDRLKELKSLKAKERPKRVSNDTLAIVVGNLIGIGMILTYERFNVVTSKAFGLIVRPKTDTSI